MHAPAETRRTPRTPGCGFTREACPEAVAGLHLLWTACAPGDARARRLVLRRGVDTLIAGWRWHCERRSARRRLCTGLEGARKPPISVAYSGTLAAVLVSSDDRDVGVDLEMAPDARLGRYARIVEAFTRQTCEEAMWAFVRAEAWVKATERSFLACAGDFLAQSHQPGPREDGLVVCDIDARRLLPAAALAPGFSLAAAICTDALAPPCRLHPARQVDADGRLFHGPVLTQRRTGNHG